MKHGTLKIAAFLFLLAASSGCVTTSPSRNANAAAYVETQKAQTAAPAEKQRPCRQVKVKAKGKESTQRYCQGDDGEWRLARADTTGGNKSTQGRPQSSLSSFVSADEFVRRIDGKSVNLVQFVKRDGAIYVLTTQTISDADYRIDPDKVKSYMAGIVITKIEDGKVLAQKEIDRLYSGVIDGKGYPGVIRGAMKGEPEGIKVFISEKGKSNDYGQNGYIYVIDQDDLNRIGTRETLFANANWGWFPYFDENSLFHFSFAGYYEVENEKGRARMKPDEAALRGQMWKRRAVEDTGAPVNGGHFAVEKVLLASLESVVHKGASALSDSREVVAKGKENTRRVRQTDNGEWKLATSDMASVTNVAASQGKVWVSDAAIRGSYKGGTIMDKATLKAHGQGVATGKDRYEGEFKFGEKHGEGVYFYSNGTSTKGNYVDDELKGFGVLLLSKNDRHLGRFQEENRGRWKGDKYAVAGMFNIDPPLPGTKWGNTLPYGIVGTCKDQEDCQDSLAKLERLAKEKMAEMAKNTEREKRLEMERAALGVVSVGLLGAMVKQLGEEVVETLPSPSGSSSSSASSYPDSSSTSNATKVTKTQSKGVKAVYRKKEYTFVECQDERKRTRKIFHKEDGKCIDDAAFGSYPCDYLIESTIKWCDQ